MLYVLLGVAIFGLLVVKIAYDIGMNRGRKETWAKFIYARKQAQLRFELSKAAILSNVISTREKRHG